MEGRVQDRADVGIVAFMIYPEIGGGSGALGDIYEYLASLDYFQLLEITHIEDEAVRAKCRQTVAAAGKSVAFGAHPAILMNKLDLGHGDAGERQKAVDAVKGAIDEAYGWGAAGLAFLSGLDPGASERSRAIGHTVDSVLQLCDHAADQGDMPLLLEAFDRAPYAKNCLLGPSEEVAEFALQVRKTHPSFGVLVDQAHMTLLEERTEDCLGVLREFLVHAHVGNCVISHPDHEAYGDNHPRFGIPEGENGLDELAEFLAGLASIGYFAGDKKGLSFELKPCSGETAEEIISESTSLLDAAWTQA